MVGFRIVEVSYKNKDISIYIIMKVSELRKMVDEISEDYDDNEVLVSINNKWESFYKLGGVSLLFLYQECDCGKISNVEHISDVSLDKRKYMKRAVILS